jgi:hypothetical protein
MLSLSSSYLPEACSRSEQTLRSHVQLLILSLNGL